MPIGGNYGPPVVDFSPLANLLDPIFKRREEDRNAAEMAKYLDQKQQGLTGTAPLAALGAREGINPGQATPDPDTLSEADVQKLEAGFSKNGLPVMAGGEAKMAMPPEAYAPLIQAAAAEHGLDPGILTRQLAQESNFNPNAVSSAGARGIAQFMPGTARRFGINPNDPEQAIPAAAKYVAANRELFGGNMGLALAGYNWGEGNVKKWLANGADPTAMPDETRNYVASITGKPVEGWVSGNQQPADLGVKGGVVAQYQIPGTAAPSAPATPAAPAAINGVGISPQRYQTLRGIITTAPHSPAAALALKEIESAGKTPQAVEEFVWARRNGLTQANSPVEYAREKEKPDSIIQQYNLAKSQGFTGGIIDFKKSTNPPGTTVNVGPNGEPFGAPEAGLAWKRTPDGKIAVDERGAPIALPYQGGKAFLKAEEEKTSAAAKEGQKQTTRTVISDDVDRSLNLIKTAKWPTTGGLGAFMANIGGTEAHNLQQLLGGLKANVGFGELQKMRDASPTGGALGSVTEGEHKLLQSVYGSLEQSQTKEQLIYNLKRFNAVQEHVIHNGLNDPAGLKEKLGELRVSNNEARAAGLLDDKNKPITQRGPGGLPPGMPSPTATPKRFTREEFDAAPRGTVYMAPDGNLRTKP